MYDYTNSMELFQRQIIATTKKINQKEKVKHNIFKSCPSPHLYNNLFCGIIYKQVEVELHSTRLLFIVILITSGVFAHGGAHRKDI